MPPRCERCGVSFKTPLLLREHCTRQDCASPPEESTAPPIPSQQQSLASLKEAGNDAFKSGQFAAAVELYTAALALPATPNFQAVLWSNLSAAHLSNADPVAAVFAATRATALDSANAKAWNRLGGAQQASGDFAAARVAFASALASNAPESSRECAERSLARLDAMADQMFAKSNQILQTGDRMNALRELLRCVRLNPAHLAAHKTLAAVGAELCELEGLKPDHLLLGLDSSGERTAFPQPDAGIPVLVFQSDGLWQGGAPTLLPASPTNGVAMRLAARAAGIDLREEPGVAAFTRGGAQLGAEVPWSAVAAGDWICVGRAMRGTDCTAVKAAPSCWPQRRCPEEVLTGEVQRVARDAALPLMKRRWPLVVTGSRLIAPAVGKWDLEYIEQSVPSMAEHFQKFPVYHGDPQKRVFRWYDDSKGRAVPGCYKTHREALSFRDFCERKRRSCAGEDSMSYYLWGSLMQRETLPDGSSEMQGMHWGDQMREDFEHTDWPFLEEACEALGSAKDVIRSQLFLGCRDALTPAHYDMLDNVYYQVAGFKRFILFDPAYTGALYPYPAGSAVDRVSQVDLESVNVSKFPRFLQEARGVEAVLGPGDLLVLPAGWWHHVQSLTEDSVSVNFWFEAPSLLALHQRVGSPCMFDSWARVLLARAMEASCEEPAVWSRMLTALREELNGDRGCASGNGHSVLNRLDTTDSASQLTDQKHSETLDRSSDQICACC